MDNSEIKKALQQVLAEKGDYKTLSRMLVDDEKRAKDEDKSNQLTKLITPISAFADILTENSKGAFMEDLEKRLDEGVAAKVTEHKDELDTALASFKTELNDLLAQGKANLTTENLQSYQDAETKLTSAMMEQAIDTVARKAAEMLPTISESARLTPEDISDIIDTAALTVESQVERIIGEYIEDFGITVDQITDFKAEVQKLIPAVDFSGISVDYSQVRNAPQGGTSAVLVNQLITKALEGFSGSGLPNQTGQDGKFLKSTGVEGAEEWETISEGGDMLGSNNLSDVADVSTARTNLGLGTAAQSATGAFATAAQGTKADSAQQPPSEGAFVNGDKTKLDTYSEANQTTNNAKVTYPSADSTKVGHITVTQAVNLDTMESDIANKANTADLATVATTGDYDDLSNKPDLSVFDNISEHANLAAFPATGAADKFYLAQDTGILYRWTGSAYAVISAELALGETISTAYRGDRGAAAFAHVSATDNPHNVSKSQVGLSNVPNTDFTSEVNANNAKVTNATHTGDVTGATALTIANNAVTNAMIAGSGTRDATTFYRGDGTFATPPTGGTVDVLSNVATARIIGRTTAGSGDSEELTAAQTRTLINVEDGATADQTGAQIKTAYEAEANAFTDTKNTKLSGIETSADVTDVTNVTAAGALMDSEIVNLAQVKAFDSTDYAAALGADDNYVTDAEKTVIGNTSGSNSGDQDLSALATKANVLELDNTTAFTPDADYEPATKKYVDDNAGGAETREITTEETWTPLTGLATDRIVSLLCDVTGGTFTVSVDGTETSISDQSSNVYKVTSSLSVVATSSGFNLDRAVYSSNNFSVSSQDSFPVAVSFNADGTSMFVLGLVNKTVYQYTLSTGYDVSTASYASKSFSVNSQETAPYGLAFNTDGTSMFVLGVTNDTVYQYTLSTGFDVSTASYASKSFSVNSQDANPFSLAFSSDGDIMYIVGASSKAAYQYTLSTDFDVSTASYASKSLSLSAVDSSPSAITFNADGSKLFYLGQNNKNIYEYTLSTEYDISTATYTSKSFSVGSEEGSPLGFAFVSNGEFLYIIGRDQDTVFQYNLNASVNGLFVLV